LQVDPSDRSRVDSPDASECNMIRLTMEVSASTGPGKDEVGISSSTVVEGLMNLIQSGNSLLEDVAIVGACSLRGRAAFPAEDNMWYTQEIEVVTRVVRKIAGRECVITAHRAVSPLAVRLIATECSSDDEFILCLDDDDICALLGQKSPLRHMHELGKELVDALIEKLTFLNCKAETPVLVAIATVVAPRTELNVSPLAATIDCVVQDTPSIMDQGAAQTLVEPNVNSTRVLLEDVFFLRSRFFVFSVYEDLQSSLIHLHLYESGTCEGFVATLPSSTRFAGNMNFLEQERLQQLRSFVQTHQFGDLTLYLAAEDIDIPPAYLLRIGRGDTTKPYSWFDADQQIYCIPCSRHSPHYATVSVVPSRHTKRLQDFVRSEIDFGKWSISPGGTGHGTTFPSTHATGQQRNQNGDVESIILSERTQGHKQRQTQAGIALAQLMAASEHCGNLLLTVGRRLPAPQGTSVLCVITVHEHSSPHLHFTIIAYEVGKSRSWALLLDSLEIYRLIGRRRGIDIHLPHQRSLLAE